MSNKSNESDHKAPLCFVVGPIGEDASAERKHSGERAALALKGAEGTRLTYRQPD